MIESMCPYVEKHLLPTQPPAVQKFRVRRAGPQKIGIRTIRQKSNLLPGDSTALEMVNEPVSNRGNLPGLTKEVILQVVREPKQAVIAHKAKLLGNIYLQIRHIVDIRYAAQPLHQNSH